MMPHQIGASAEAYVYYRLLSWDYDVHFASGIATQFDLWVNLGGKPIRIQVKGTCNLERKKGGESRTNKYCFGTAKGCSKKVIYEKTDYDILALVALPKERVYFTTKPRGKTTRIETDRFNSEEERASWTRVFKQLC